MSQLEHQKPTFKNFDGIRFIAFTCVFFSHTFYSRDPTVTQGKLYQLINFFAGQWGDLGLSVFFVMSGFLITYLLLQERHVTGSVHVFSFYSRRILRIWPLYFVIVAFNFYVYASITGNHELTKHQLPYYFFFVNQDVIDHGFHNGIADHFWAISVEEQFYLVLPLIMSVIPDRRLNYAFILAIIAALIFRAVHYREPSMIFFHSVSAAFEIALGGLAAWMMFFNLKAKEYISNLSAIRIVIIYSLFAVLILFQNYFFSPSLLIVLVLVVQLFALFIILEQSYAAQSLFKIGKTKWVSQLGKYSYGFFCYHIICIRLIEAVSIKLNLKEATVWVVPMTSLALTIAIGIASYHLFEIHFLNLKKKFSYLN